MARARLDEVTIVFPGGTRVLEGVSLTVEESEFLVLMVSVRDNPAFGMRLQHVPAPVREQRVLDVVQLLSIDELLDREPKALSGGKRQRVAVGRAVVRNPRVPLMDVLLSNLDGQLRVTMRAKLWRLHAEHRTTTTYVPYDQVEAMTLGDRIAVLDGGRVQQVGTPPHDLYHRPVNAFVAGFIGSPSMNLAVAPVRAGALPTME
ncbi:ABC transporter ATP-binding protein [Micromonospora chersina]|uniref:ABC transporter ATP-binding protein n=1 Tax=Micromonospora chersina TaxID=47854 RepID=UPI0033D345FA